jgi:predicted outer membrane repeat protein
VLSFSAQAQTISPDNNGIVYVKSNATGNQSGDSWANACHELAAALNAANANPAITQIRLAEGTWYPQDKAGNGTEDRDKAFVLASNVKIYGGFENENFTDATPPAYGSAGRNGQTILSGNIGDPNESSDDAFHVVIAAGDLNDAALDGLIIERGNANDANSTTINISIGNTTIYVNRSYGGGLYNMSSIHVNHVLFRNNLAIYGGGIRTTSSPSFTNVVIRNNGAPLKNSNGGNINTSHGGGMYNDDPLKVPVLENVTIENNTAGSGGGMYNNFCSPKLTNVSISGNSATEGTSFRNGGGMYNNGASPDLTNVLISGNKSTQQGGGMYNDGGSPKLTNVTIVGNYSDANNGGGGMYNASTATPKLYNSIIWGNRANTAGANIYNSSAVPRYAYCLVEGSGGSGSWIPSFGLNDGNNIDVGSSNPYFFKAIIPNDSNTPTTEGDYHITLCSPAYNAGNNTLVPATVTVDLSGRPRIAGTNVDMGAYESAAITPAGNRIYVNQNVTGGNKEGASWANAAFELADALLYAATHAGVTEIWVAEGTYRPRYSAEGSCMDGVRDNAFVMANGVTIYGGFAGTETAVTQRNWTKYPTVLSGDIGVLNNPSDNAFHVVIFADVSSSSGLDGVTVTDGNANGSGSISVNGKTISQSKGGGVYSDGSSNASFLRRSIVSGNTATDGAGVYLADGATQFYSSLISGNHATGNGGGIYTDAGAASQLLNLTISGNNAANGGGIYNNGGAPAIKNTIVWGNSGNPYGITAADYSLIEGAAALTGVGNLDGTDSGNDPQFLNPLLPSQAPTVNGDYRLSRCVLHPVVNVGDNTGINAADTDLGGLARIIGTNVDMGAYEVPTLASISGNILYVNKKVSGSTEAGDSWPNAFHELSDALRTAAELNNLTSGTVTAIWVAEGVYTPLYSANGTGCQNGDRDNAFVIQKNVKIYGGFAGTETVLTDRNWAIHPTVLSGDIGNEDDRSDNAYHVVVAADDIGTALLDGFTVTGGNADGSGTIVVNGQNVPRNTGGGICLYSASPEISHVIVSGNEALNGAGIYANANANLTVSNSLFSGNKAKNEGGGIYCDASANQLKNVTVSGNDALSPGGGSGIKSTTGVTLTNTIVWGNGNNNVSGSYSSTYSLIEGSSDTNNGNLNGTTVDLHFVNSVSYTLAPTAAGDYRVVAGSPTIDAGNDYSGADSDLDLNCRPRKNGTAPPDMGAYEDQRQPVTLSMLNYPPSPVLETFNCSPHPVSFTPKVTGMGAITVKYTKSGTTTTQAPTDAGAYQISIEIAAGTDYLPATFTATQLAVGPLPYYLLSIDKANLTVADLDFTPKSVPYDGNVHTVTLVAKDGKCIDGIGTATIKYDNTLSNANHPKNQKAYAVTVSTVDGANFYAAPNLSLGNFTIGPPALPPAGTGQLNYVLPDPTTYDGQPHPVSVTGTATPAEMGAITVKYTKGGVTSTTAPVNAGIYKVSVDIGGGSKYSGVTGLELGNFTILKADIDARWLGFTPTTVVYNGSPQGVTVTVSLPEGMSGAGVVTPSYTGSGYPKNTAPPTNAGSYSLTVNMGAGDNFNGGNDLNVSGSFVIEKAAVTLTFPTASAIDYGNPLADSNLSGGGATATPSTSGTFDWKDKASITRPKVNGSYYVIFTPDDAANYDYSGETGYSNVGGVTVTRQAPVTIHTKAVTVTGVSAANKAYDRNTTATAVTTGAAINGLLSGDVVAVVKGAAQFADPNVGTHTVSFSGFTLGGTDGANYTLSAQPSDVTATITPRIIGLNVMPIPKQVYDGTPKEPPLNVWDNAWSIELVLNQDYQLAYKNNILPGIATVDVTGIGNYAGNIQQATFSILKKTGLLEISQGDIPYGETPHPQVLQNESGGAVTFMYKGKNMPDDSYSSDIPTVPGEYVVRGTAAETEFYALLEAFAYFTIENIQLSFADYAIIKWDNTLMLNMKKLREDGIEVSSCWWYKNGESLGEGFAWSQGPLESDLLETGDYSFELATVSGHGNIHSNQLSYVRTQIAMKVYPNPLISGQTLTLEGCETESGYIRIYNAMGRIVQEIKSESDITTATLHQPEGIYFIKTGRQTIKLVIKSTK